MYVQNVRICAVLALIGFGLISAQNGRDDQRSFDTSLAYAASRWFGRSVGAWDPA
jgi:hypothetical protein